MLEKYNKKCEKERPEYEVLDWSKDEYKNYSLKVRHKITGRIDWIGYGALFHSKNNPRSMSNKKEIDKEEFINRVEDKFGVNKYTVHTFDRFDTKCLITCHTCDRTFWYIARNFLNRGCGKCKKLKTMKRRTKTQETFEKEVFDAVGNEYTFLEKYRNGLTKLKVRHNICNHEYYIAPNVFLKQEVRCPKCICSRGEKEIIKHLDLLKISYKKEYQYKDCKHERQLRFDFAIFDKDNDVFCLIENQGLQHYEARPFGGMDLDKAEKEFELTKLRDSIKKEYCVANNIKLIEIPYWDFKNIPTIINKIYSELQGDL